jgi:hypothetical protein
MNDQPTNQTTNGASEQRNNQPALSIYLINQSKCQRRTKVTKRAPKQQNIANSSTSRSAHCILWEVKLSCGVHLTLHNPTAAQRNFIILKKNTINCTKTTINGIVQIYLILLICFGLPRTRSEETECEVENYKQLITVCVLAYCQWRNKYRFSLRERKVS